jgi:hypothetical protein
MSFMSGLFGGPKIPEPQPAPPLPAVPQQEGPEISQARDRQRQLLAAMKGNSANWLTGPSGLTAPAPVAQKMLFGS